MFEDLPIQNTSICDVVVRDEGLALLLYAHVARIIHLSIVTATAATNQTWGGVYLAIWGVSM